MDRPTLVHYNSIYKFDLFHQKHIIRKSFSFYKGIPSKVSIFHK